MKMTEYKEKSYILAIDQSTSNTKAVLFSNLGELIDRYDVPHRQIVKGDRVEHDAEEIYRNTICAVRELVARNLDKKARISSVAITNQRETAVCFDIKTGEPLYNAIVWQDGRAKKEAERLEKDADYIRRATGLKLSPYFSAPKYVWIKENVEKARLCAERGDFRCCNIDAWLLFKLAGEYKTDITNASRTLLFNLDTLSYDEKILSAFGLKKEFLPEICYSDELFGYTDFEGIFEKKLPIKGVAGDSHAALFANTDEVGGIKATFGTGTSLLLNVGEKRMTGENSSVVESVAFSKNGKVFYGIEGNINYSGAVMNKVIDLGLAKNVKEIASSAASIDGNDGVYLVPAFSGLSAPYWDDKARAVICGMNASTKREHILRAAEEAVAYQIKDVFEEIKICGGKIEKIYADGGATKDKFIMQFVSDLLGIEVSVSLVEELSAFGVAALAAGDAKFFLGKSYVSVSPKMEESQKDMLYRGWKQAVQKALS